MKIQNLIIIILYCFLTLGMGFLIYFWSLNPLYLDYLKSLNLTNQLILTLASESLPVTTLMIFLFGLPLVYLPARSVFQRTSARSLFKVALIFVFAYILTSFIAYIFISYDPFISKILFFYVTSLTLGLIFGFITWPYYDRVCGEKIKKIASFVLSPTSLFIFAFAIYSLYSLLNHYYFGTSAFDFGIYIQVIWRLSRFQIPESTVANNPNFLGWHFELFLLPLSLIYRFWSSPVPILLTQSLVLSSGVFPVYKLAKETLKSNLASSLIATAYMFFFGIQSAVGFDFHSIVFATPLIAWSLFFLIKKNYRNMSVSLFFLALVRENAALYVSFFGLYLIFFESKKILGFLIFFLSLGYFQLLNSFIMPFLSPVGTTDLNEKYAAFGSSFPEMVRNVLQNPVVTLLTILNSQLKVESIILTFGSFSFLSLLSFRSLFLMSPLLLEKYLTNIRVINEPNYHYSVNFVSYLIFGAMLAIKNLTNVTNSRLKISLVASLLLSNIFLSAWSYLFPYPLWTIGQKIFVSEEKKTDTVNNYEALKLIPHNASVYSQNNFLPHLANREEIGLLTNEYSNKYDFVLINTLLNYYPMTKNELKEITEEYLNSSEYGLIFSKGATLVFKKGVTDSASLSPGATKLLGYN